MINNLFYSLQGLVSDIKGAFSLFASDVKDHVKEEVKSVKKKIKKLNPLAKSKARGRSKKA